MAAIFALSDPERAQLQAQAEQIVQSEIYPAWRSAIALLESQLPIATDDAGLWRLNNGPAAYAYFLRRSTTTDMTPDQIHELGLRQVETIDRQMDQLLRRLGRNDGSVKDRIDQLRQDTTYPSPGSDESRSQVMRDIEAILRDAEKRATLLFDKTPKAPVVAQPFPRFREANAAASYSTPLGDGSRPGLFQFPLRRDWMTKVGLRSTVYHETVPGHHFDLWGWRTKSYLLFDGLASLGALPHVSKGGGSMPSVLPLSRDGTKTIPKASWGSSIGSSFAPGALLSIQEFTPNIGQDSRRSTTASKLPRSNATWSGRDKHVPT